MIKTSGSGRNGMKSPPQIANHSHSLSTGISRSTGMTVSFNGIRQTSPLSSCVCSCRGGAGKKDVETKTSVLQWHFESTLERNPFDFIPAVDQPRKLFVGGFLFLNKLIFQLSMSGLISSEVPSQANAIFFQVTC